ncbi:MAG: aldehyde ferredoxin oxidoreductase [Deltaproteobacteria bacterium]|nr:aldehyde ferredoxin oxidoreductase [Deltaproteobacteria bacterium]
MARIMRVNMTTQQVALEEAAPEYQGLGGRGLTSTIVSKEVPPLCNPIGPNNKLVFAPGLLSGTSAPISGRISVGGKSPLTGTIKESNAGGQGAIFMARCGLKAIVVEGKAPSGKLYKLLVNKDGGVLSECPELKGSGNYDVAAKLRDEQGDKAVCISIGPCGEMQMQSASVAVTDIEGRPTRHAGRGGMGAVMGSKGLKAIVVDPTDAPRIEPINKDAFTAACKKLNKALQEHPVTGQGLPTYGTNVLANIINEAAAYPTNSFSKGQFAETGKISGETQHDVILERGGKIAHPCHTGCVIRCSRIYNDKEGGFLSKGPEYETIWANGANCGISDLDAIAMIDRLCDDYGLDTIEVGVTIGVAMDAGIKAFGDAQGAIELVHEMGKGTSLGRILGAGAAVTGKCLGVEDVAVVKGQGLPAYDPRPILGIGVTYATSTMGADHTAGYAIAGNILGIGTKVDPMKVEGQVELSRNLQIATAALDCTGLCLFTAFAVLDKPEAFDAIYEMLNGLYGLNLGADDVVELGKNVLRTERSFNQAAGFTPKHDRLPEFFKMKPLSPLNVVFTVTDEQLDQVFNF